MSWRISERSFLVPIGPILMLTPCVSSLPSPKSSSHIIDNAPHHRSWQDVNTHDIDPFGPKQINEFTCRSGRLVTKISA